MRTALLGLLLSAPAALAAPPEFATKFAPPAPMPAPKPPEPAPAPSPVGPVALASDSLLVWDFDVPVLVLASPQGLVKVTHEGGPLRVRAKFADGSGKVETRDYKGKHVVTVEALASGRVELLVIPLGLTGAEDVRRVAVQVEAGDGPIPPPKPKPDVDPKPPEPQPDPTGPLRVIFVYETNKPLAREQQAAIFSPEVEKYLDARCAKDAKGKPEWKRFDKDQQFAADFNPTLKALFQSSVGEAAKSLPAVVVAVGREATVYPVTTEADLLALLKKHAGK